MIKTLSSAVFVVALFGSSLARPGQLVDAVIATVDNEAILYSEIEQQMPRVRRALEEQTDLTQAAKQEQYAKEFERVLEESIESKILYREAVKLEMSASDKAIDDYIQGFREGYDTDEEFFNDLRTSGTTVSDFRERIRKLALAQAVSSAKRQALRREITIAEDAIQEYYEKYYENYTQPERVYFRQIMIQAPRDSEERAEAIQQLNELREQALADADFGALAREYSQAPGAEEGGIVGWATRGDFIPAVEEQLFSLEVGGVSEPIENQFGVLLVKVEDRQEEGTPTAREIRTQIEPILLDEAVDERYDRWMRDLRRRNRVRVFW